MARIVDWTRPRFLFVALLSSALWLNGCAEDAPAAPVKTGGTKSPAKGDDDKASNDDDDSSEPEDDSSDDSDDTAKPAAKPDAGTTKPKLDASTADAKAPTDTTKKPDAGSDTPADTTDGGGSSTTGGDDTDGGKTAAPHQDEGMGDGHDVITIGDSWMQYLANGGGIERGLKDASKQKYRNYGVTGVKLLEADTFGPAIPSQYDAAKKANPDIKTVVMTGGGNDILMLALGDAMKTIDKVAVRLDQLWKQMAADGVKDVVYIEYSEGGSNGPNVQYGIKTVKPVCDSQTGLRCHFMLSDPIIHMQLYAGDGLNVHPTQDGCTKLGKAAFDLMTSEGMRR